MPEPTYYTIPLRSATPQVDASGDWLRRSDHEGVVRELRGQLAAARAEGYQKGVHDSMTQVAITGTVGPNRSTSELMKALRVLARKRRRQREGGNP